MAEKIMIRGSSLSSYPDCLRRTASRIFAADIIEAGYELKTLSVGIGAATGTGTHSGAGYLLQTKIDTGVLGSIDDAKEKAIESLHYEIDPGVMWDATSPNLNTAEKQVLRQVASYGMHVAPTIDPESVEEYLEQPLIEGGNIWITGHTDVKIVRGIRDTKTGIRRRANGYQYGCYSLLYRSTGLDVEFLIEDFVPRVAISKEQPKPELHYYDVKESELAAYAIINRMVADLEVFRATADPWSWLANPMSMLCSPKYCPAYDTEFCKAHLQDEK